LELSRGDDGPLQVFRFGGGFLRAGGDAFFPGAVHRVEARKGGLSLKVGAPLHEVHLFEERRLGLALQVQVDGGVDPVSLAHGALHARNLGHLRLDHPGRVAFLNDGPLVLDDRIVSPRGLVRRFGNGAQITHPQQHVVARVDAGLPVAPGRKVVRTA
jgi:hypothetical protein